MLIVDLLLAILLVALTGYLMYSTYTVYSATTDPVAQTTLKQSVMIQVVQMLLGFGFLYTAFTTTAAVSTPAYAPMV